jgi:hypothetical protein
MGAWATERELTPDPGRLKFRVSNFKLGRMCAIGQCSGVWMALHGINHTILAVGGRGKTGKQIALFEAKKRQAEYGPPGPIPTVPPYDVNCYPALKKGPAAERITAQLRAHGLSTNRV